MRIVVRIILSAVAYVIGVVVTGVVAPILRLPVLHAPGNSTPEKMFLMLALSTPLLTIGCIPLAAGLRGCWARRFAAIAVLLYVAIGLNTMIEAKIFTSMLEGGSALGASLYALLPCLLASAVLATTDTEPGASSTMDNFHLAGWGWRLLVAWLMFPVIYWTFGMCVAPFVVPYYKAGGGAFGLHIPPIPTILTTQLLRSALFLAASFPAIWLWRKSRMQFIAAMGLAHAMAVGVFQLASATVLPTVLRVAHSIEITADSFVYAAVLGLLFVAKQPARQMENAPAEITRPVAV